MKAAMLASKQFSKEEPQSNQTGECHKFLKCGRINIKWAKRSPETIKYELSKEEFKEPASKISPFSIDERSPGSYMKSSLA